jgi:predicted ATPase
VYIAPLVLLSQPIAATTMMDIRRTTFEASASSSAMLHRDYTTSTLLSIGRESMVAE